MYIVAVQEILEKERMLFREFSFVEKISFGVKSNWNSDTLYASAAYDVTAASQYANDPFDAFYLNRFNENEHLQP